MNSTLQCLYAVPELRQSLAAAAAAAPPGAAAADPAAALTAAAGGLFGALERSAQAVPPLAFVSSLRRAHPQFDQRSREGHHMQQDAEECWSALLLSLRERVRDADGASAVNRLFGVRTRAVLKCDETEETMEVRRW
jgi:ubiquitin carboxyl-terminal hydrolase 14